MGAELDAIYWWQNIRLPVVFQAALEALIGGGVRRFIEIGPAPVLQSFLRDALARAGQPGHVLASLMRQRAERDPFAAIAAACHVGGGDIDGARALDGFATAVACRAMPGNGRRSAPSRPSRRSSWRARSAITRCSASATRCREVTGCRT